MQIIYKYFPNLSEKQIKQFSDLKKLYEYWNTQINVISRKDIDKLYNNDISIGINSDGRAISNTDLNKEYSLLSKYYSWGNKHFLNCNLNAINASFASQKVKNKIISTLINNK